MASIVELLEKLTAKEVAVSTADLAKELKASKEGTLKQLTREKDKGNVEGTSQEGWLITDVGRKALEKGDIRPTMIDEGVTPRQQFEAIGRRIGIKEDRIVLATDIVWSGDYEDVKFVWEALGREGADLADDLRRVWANAWRAKLRKGIPPELEAELTGAKKVEAEAEVGATPSKPGGRDYIIDGDDIVRVGENLGDYSLQDAKEILGLRALKSRFSGGSQAGGASRQGTGPVENVSDLINALTPLLKKDSDINQVKEIITDKLALQKQEILSHIPQPGQGQPKTFLEQITDFVSLIGTMKEAGPVVRSIFGLPESPSNPGGPTAALPVQMTGADGKPIIMDLSNFISLRKFEGEERRADERLKTLTGIAQTVRENLPDGIQAIAAAAQEAREERKGDSKTKPPEQPQMYKCADCGTEFSAPLGWEGQNIKCPNPKCSREYTKEELTA